MSVRYVSRDEWGAGPIGAGHAVPHSQFTGLAVHHTVMVMPDYDRDGFLHGDLDDIKRYMRQLQVSRPDLGIEVPYSQVVFRGARDGDCVVAEGRGFGRTGAHTAGQNSSRYGVAYAGNASTDPATDGVVDGIRWVGSKLANPAGARPTIGHRDVKATECPGNHLYARLDELQPPFNRTPEGEDDMPSVDDLLTGMAKALGTPGHPLRHAFGEIVDGQLVLDRDALAQAVVDRWADDVATPGRDARKALGEVVGGQVRVLRPFLAWADPAGSPIYVVDGQRSTARLVDGWDAVQAEVDAGVVANGTMTWHGNTVPRPYTVPADLLARLGGLAPASGS